MSTAATLSGVFDVTSVNVTYLYDHESRATMENFEKAVAGTLGDDAVGPGVSEYTMDTFVWTGDIAFRVDRGDQPDGNQRADFTVGQWLDAPYASGVATGLSTELAGKQLSFPRIYDGNATTTFFLFELRGTLTAGDFTVKHDDGIWIYDDGVARGGLVGPTGEKTTTVNGFDGGKFSLLYVATNGNPSILEVDSTAMPAVPLPAGLPLLIAGVGAFVVVARRKRGLA